MIKDTTAGGVEAVREALRRAADEAYRVCAETWHVTLGNQARAAVLALTPPATGDGAGAADISAAARILDAAGRHHGWWKGATYDDLDKISKDEFDDIVAAIIKAASPAPAPAADDTIYQIEHDGFCGTRQGSYTTREGKRGVVLQQVGTRVVHVYGEKWLVPSPKAGETGNG